VDVCVYRDGRLAEAEQEHAGGRLGADAAETGEISASVCQLQAGEKIEVEATVLGVEPLEGTLDARRLDPCQTTNPNRRLDFLDRCSSNGVETAETIHERVKGPSSIDIRRVLGQHRRDELC
jgi:hypothetical protein